MWLQPLFGLLRNHKEKSGWAGVIGGRAPFHKVVNVHQKLAPNRFRPPCPQRARFAEQNTERGVIQHLVHDFQPSAAAPSDGGFRSHPK